jgi:hypothetical protein
MLEVTFAASRSATLRSTSCRRVGAQVSRNEGWGVKKWDEGSKNGDFMVKGRGLKVLYMWM